MARRHSWRGIDRQRFLATSMRHSNHDRPRATRRRAFLFERLEDRLVMAADLAYAAEVADGDQVVAPTIGFSDTAVLWTGSRDNRLDVLSNDMGDSLQIVDFTPPSAGGELQISPAGNSLLYSPPTSYRGSVYFSYTVRGADGISQDVGIHLNIIPRIELTYDWLEADENSRDVKLDILANDHLNDPELSPVIEAIEQPLTGGTFRIADDGKSLLFTAIPGFLGGVAATYTLRLSDTETIQGQVHVNVARPLLAVDDWFNVDPTEGATLGVLSNDLVNAAYNNVRGQSRQLRIVSVIGEQSGSSVSISEDGATLAYVPATGFTGDEILTYEVEDQFGNRDRAEVRIRVSGQATSGIGAFLPGELEVRLLQLAAQQWSGTFGRQTADPNGYWGYPWICICGDIAYDALFVRAFDVDANASSTNSQVVGVDEADLIETDGEYLYTFSQGKLTIVDIRDPAALRLVSITDLQCLATSMYLDGDRLTIIGTPNVQGYGYYDYYDGSKTAVSIFDIADPASPTLVRSTELDGRLIASRSIEGQLHLVLSNQLKVPMPKVVETTNESGGTSHRYETWEEYVARMRASDFEEALPQFTSYSASGEEVASGAFGDPSDVKRPFSEMGTQLISVVTIDVHSDSPEPVAMETWTDGYVDANSIYMTRDSIYFWSTESPWAGNEQTIIRKVDISELGEVELVAVGKIDGKVVDQFSFDERDGRLSVVTTTTTRQWGLLTGENNDLYVLEQVGAELVIVGHLADFAAGESVRSVRFDGDRALVVTFPDEIFDPTIINLPRDPLFVIDLSDPTAPTITSELVVPGFSTYLQLIEQDRLLGFGKDIDPETGENRGVLLSLFQMAGLGETEILDQFRFELPAIETSLAIDDHLAIAYYPEQKVVAVPISWREPIEGSSWQTREVGELWMLSIDTEAGGGFELLSRIRHDTSILRTVRVGNILYAISGDNVTAHHLTDPTQNLDHIYLAKLPQDDVFHTTEDSGPVTIDVLFNDRPSEDGQPLSIVEVTQPVSSYYGASESIHPGVVEIPADGRSVVFTPAADFFGGATFTYTVWDESRGFQTATVTVYVAGTPDDPDAVNDVFFVAMDSVATTLDVLANDLNPDGPYWGYGGPMICDIDYVPLRVLPVLPVSLDLVSNSLSIAKSDAMFIANDLRLWVPNRGLVIIEVGPADQGGVVEIDELTGNLRYSPAAGFIGVETITYTVLGSDGRTDTATVTIQVGEISEDVPDSALAATSSPMQETNSPARNATSEAAPAVTPAAIDAAMMRRLVEIASYRDAEPSRSIQPRTVSEKLAESSSSEAMLISLLVLERQSDFERSRDDVFVDFAEGGDFDASAELPHDLAFDLAAEFISVR
jgi:uncharacterized secreted protein with C-terminal beta-propeller domain